MDYFEEMENRIPVGGVRTRFAPSPTGYMHIGNLRTALYTWLIAKKTGGKFILRIEDTDKSREVFGSSELIYRTLRECGLNHDEGPDLGGPVGPYIQSQRKDIYKRYSDMLVEKGDAYYCFCEKPETSAGLEEEVAPATCGFGTTVLTSGFEPVNAPDPCRFLDPEASKKRVLNGEPYVVRQKIPQTGETTFHDIIYGDITVPNDSLDDQILLKSDGFPTYNFANVVDDHLMGITHVVRGNEYLPSAPKYNLLYKSFGWETPKYVHCPPVMRDSSHKMSKRHGDPSYQDLREMGFLTDAIINYVALLGWSPRGEIAQQEFFTLDELKVAFDIEGISKSPAIFDIEKLKYFNAEYIRNMTKEEFFGISLPYIRKAVQNPALSPAKIAPLLQKRCEILSDIPPKLDFFDNLPEYDTKLYTNKKSKTTAEISLKMLKEALKVLTKLNTWDEENIKTSLSSLAMEFDYKNSTVMWPVRIAVSGREVTPGGVVEICDILGKDESLRRIRLGIQKLERS